MIDEIIEMILKEARARDRNHPLRQWPEIKEELDCRLFDILDTEISNEGRKKEDENKG